MAVYVMCMADIRGLLQLSSVVHTGTNQKAQQSCGGGTRLGVCGTPGLSWNTLGMWIQTRVVDNTMKMLYTIEDSRLQSQGCSRHIATIVWFKQSEPLKVSIAEPSPHHTWLLLY